MRVILTPSIGEQFIGPRAGLRAMMIAGDILTEECETGKERAVFRAEWEAAGGDEIRVRPMTLGDLLRGPSHYRQPVTA